MKKLFFLIAASYACALSVHAQAASPTQPPTSASIAVSGGSQVVDASTVSGPAWTDKLVSAYANLGTRGGTIIVPDSIAGNGTATTPIIPSNVTLQFPGNGTFTFCALRMGLHSKILATAGATLIEKGTNCPGIEFIDATPTLQDFDHPRLQGVRVNCAGAPNSTGITIGPGSSGGNAMYDLENIEITGCTNVGIMATSMQFSHWRNVHAQQNYVNFKLYGSGAGSSNIFDGLKLQSPLSGVDAIIVNNSNTQDAGGNVFINPQLQNGTVAALAVIGDPGDWPPQITIYGSQPELNSKCAGPITIDSRTIPCSGAMYASNAQVEWIAPNFADAIASPDINLVNYSNLTLVDPNGYGSQFGRLVATDGTSLVNIRGTLSTSGIITNVVGYPNSIPAGRGTLAGAPVSYLDPTVLNAYSGNPLVPAFTSTTGTSSNAIANDPLYGRVNTVTFAPSAGSASGNEIQIGNVIPSGYTSVLSDYLFSILVKASATTNVSFYGQYPGGGTGFLYGSTLTLQAGQWTRVLMWNFGAAPGAGAMMTFFPNDSAGATVSFTRLESLALPGGPMGTTSYASAAARGQIIENGAVNPKGFQTDASNPSGTVRASNVGAASANGNFAFSSGWGSATAASNTAGFARHFRTTVTASGTGQAASPTITVTLPTALSSATQLCSASMTGGSGTNTTISQTILSATAPVFTFNGTPAPNATYIIDFVCGL